MVEPIEVSHHPVWEQQPDEPAEIFNLFTAYFLPLPRANLVAAYRQFLSNSGNDRQDVGNASSQWREYCDKYQWRSPWGLLRLSSLLDLAKCQR
ncbi:MAG: hypothetical protein RIQ82_1003 [Bacteroidota bacterium]